MKLPIETRTQSPFNQMVELGVPVRTAKAVSEMLALPGAKTASRVMVGNSVREARSMLCGDMSAMLKVAGPTPGGGGGGSMPNPGGAVGGSCFVGSTSISTPDGAAPISSLQPGDVVLGYDPKTETLSPRSLVAVTGALGSKRHIHIAFEESEDVFVTKGHPFLTPNGFVEAGFLEPGSEVVLANSDKVSRVLKMVTLESEEPVYNLQVEGVKTFVANNVVVHNTTIIEDADGRRTAMKMSEEPEESEEDDDLQLATDTVKLAYAVARNMGVPQERAMMMAMYAHTRLM